MNDLTAINSYKKYYGSEPSIVETLEGGQRNRVYLCGRTKEDLCVLKIHRRGGYYNFFSNEVAAYDFLENSGLKIPKKIYSDSEHNTLAISKVQGNVIQESGDFSYYRPCLDLLKESEEILKKMSVDNTFFSRDVSCLNDGVSMLQNNLNMNINAEDAYRNLVSIYSEVPRRHIIGSFMPSNIIRGSEDYHIDLEMFGIGTDTEDLAYFSIFAGIDPFSLFDYHYNNLDTATATSLRQLFTSNVLKLGYLTLGLYSTQLISPSESLSLDSLVRQRAMNILLAMERVSNEDFGKIRRRFNEINL